MLSIGLVLFTASNTVRHHCVASHLNTIVPGQGSLYSGGAGAACHAADAQYG